MDHSATTTHAHSDGCAAARYEESAVKYELRPQTRELKASFTSTWMDQDDTGDYDPAEESRKNRTRRIRARLRERGIGAPRTKSKDCAVTGQFETGEQVQEVVKLRFPSDTGRVAFKNRLETSRTASDAEHDDFSSGYKLRHKQVEASYRSPKVHGSLKPKDSVCARVKDDGNAVKGPPPPLRNLVKPKAVWTCMQCREAGRQCSFSSGGMGDDCAACETEGNICFPERTISIPQPRDALAVNSNDRRGRTLTNAKPPSPLPSKPRKTTGNGATRTIITKFRHPIVFDIGGDAEAASSCRFCDGSAFSILGLGAREIDVIDHGDGRGLTEVGPDDEGAGATQTQLCMPCTVDRAAIIMCAPHRLRPIHGVLVDTLDHDGALTALFAMGVPREQDRWCSLCPNLATHRCEAQQAAEGVMDDPLDEGCGLLLCAQCGDGLQGGDLQAMLRGLREEDRLLGLRADYELLKRDGLLMRFLEWTSRQ